MNFFLHFMSYCCYIKSKLGQSLRFLTMSYASCFSTSLKVWGRKLKTVKLHGIHVIHNCIPFSLLTAMGGFRYLGSKKHSWTKSFSIRQCRNHTPLSIPALSITLGQRREHPLISLPSDRTLSSVDYLDTVWQHSYGSPEASLNQESM